ncbi:MAG: HEPN domain-containing protein [Clostridiales bacterium]|nr:HEPN domain-containing protein [Clostridiales bacterium]
MDGLFGKNNLNLNSYLGLAENDYLFAKAGMETFKSYGVYNSVASTAAQSCEKFFKAILNQKFIDDERALKLMKSHNLRTIFGKIQEKYDDWDVDKKDVKWLGDFYFDARYPGDDFMYVGEQDALEALDILNRVRRRTYLILEEDEDGIQDNGLRELSFD